MAGPYYFAPAESGDNTIAVDSASVKFGPGALREIGYDAKGMGMTRVGLFTDKNVARLEAVDTIVESLQGEGIDVVVYDEVRCEPTDGSFRAAQDFARDGAFDGYISLGGGSVIDTCKFANLYNTYPDSFDAYVSAPQGQGKPVPGPLTPHIACSTTSGTGSETTGVSIFDWVERKLKCGMASRFLRPRLAIVDPTVTYSMPAGVVAATGFDVLTHAVESYTARPFNQRPPPDNPALRPIHQGANPYSDMGSLQAVRIAGKYLERAVADASDHEARDQVMFAATLAGIAFGNSGVHIPHAMSYSVAGLNHTYVAKGYESEDPMVPHGIAVVVNAPATFRFTADLSPERHLEAAEALGAEVRNAAPRDGGEILARKFIDMMKATGIPNGTGEIGYTEADIDEMAQGTIGQKRVLATSPADLTLDDLKGLFRAALKYW